MRHLIGCIELYGDISDPYSFVHKRQPDHDLDQFRWHDKRVHGKDRNRRIVGHDERCRDRNYPAEAGVEKECDKGLSSRPDNEIGRIVERVDRHGKSGDADEACRQFPYLVRCIVDPRKEEG